MEAKHMMSSPSMHILTMVLPKDRANFTCSHICSSPGHTDIGNENWEGLCTFWLESGLPVSLSCTHIAGTGINCPATAIVLTNTMFSKYHSHVFSSFVSVNDYSTHIYVPQNFFPWCTILLILLGSYVQLIINVN